MEITISGKDRKSLELLEQLAKKLGLTIKRSIMAKEPPRKSIPEEVYKLMEEIAWLGAFQSVKDPVAWQREIREDKPLYGREE